MIFIPYQAVDEDEIHKNDQNTQQNRETLQTIFDDLNAKTLIHGHYHNAYKVTHEVRAIIGLGHEDSHDATKILDV